MNVKMERAMGLRGNRTAVRMQLARLRRGGEKLPGDLQRRGLQYFQEKNLVGLRHLSKAFRFKAA